MAYEIDTSALIAELDRLEDEMGHSPRMDDMRDRGKYSTSTYLHRFGSWNEALERAGMEPNRQAERIPKLDVLTEISKVARSVGRAPTRPEFDAEAEMSSQVAIMRFGSWDDALEAAGYDPSDIRQWYSTDELVEEVQRVADHLGCTPSVNDMQKHGRISMFPYTDRFGGWPEALKAAGFDPPTNGKIPVEELLKEIKRLEADLGRQPQTNEMAERGEYSPGTYYNRFGSWSTALEVAEVVTAEAIAND